MIEKNIDFENELPLVIQEYTHLKIVNKEEGAYLKGLLSIPDDNGCDTGTFAVEIHSTANFPYRFPKLIEVGGDIPCDADWHKYSDNSCCFTVPANEILLCKNRMSIRRFIKEIAIPYFANQLYRKREGHYLNEYSHAEKGVLEFYIDLFQTENIEVWRKACNCMDGKIKFQRNELCYCGSKKKYKHCHLPIENKLRSIGKAQIINDFKHIALL